MLTDIVDLLDWKRPIFELYAEIRSVSDPEAAWVRWREVRDELFRLHPQSPLPEEVRARFRRVDYGPGRYVLESVKGADLGMEEGKLVLDFNFSYNPSCSYDPRWACPLTPPPNRLPIPIRAGERTPSRFCFEVSRMPVAASPSASGRGNRSPLLLALMPGMQD